MPFSKEIEKILEEQVHRLVRDDSRTNDKGPLGYHPYGIYKRVLEQGRADFSTGFGNKTAEDKVLLYCATQMPGHLCDIIKIFKKPKIQKAISELFEKNTTVLDIGCGPATACLALADQFRNKKFLYYGIDIASPMLEKAESFWNSAKSYLLNNRCQNDFFDSWKKIKPKEEIKGNIFIICSYFFASKSLNEKELESLKSFIYSLIKKSSGLVYFLYVNSSKHPAPSKYTKFRNLIGVEREPLNLNSKVAYQLIRFRGKHGGKTQGPKPIGKEFIKYAKTVPTRFKTDGFRKIDPSDQSGYCISCGNRKTYNLKRPLCTKCFEEFDSPYQESFDHCHKCGKVKKKGRLSIDGFQLCHSCWKSEK